MPTITTAQFDDVKFGSQQIGSVYYGDTTLWSPIPPIKSIWLEYDPALSTNNYFLRGEWFTPPSKYPNMGARGDDWVFEYRLPPSTTWLASILAVPVWYKPQLDVWDFGACSISIWDGSQAIEVRYRLRVINAGGSIRGWTDFVYWKHTKYLKERKRNGSFD